ncbi:MAG: YraN family protein [Clostridiales bacterium]|jgi:putative endonuclease|nr:YraN family protein [Clostridiales bacterium]
MINMDDSARDKGNFAEDMAAMYLRNKGYEIITRQFSCLFGEIDIIASYDSYIVFVEVRYRKSGNFGTPAETVNKRKQERIILTANEYIQREDITNRDFRFDIIEVTGVKEYRVNHIVNAFGV